MLTEIERSSAVRRKAEHHIRNGLVGSPLILLASFVALYAAPVGAQEVREMPLSRDVWQADDEYVEAGMRMAAFLALAQGDRARAKCIDIYISSPFGVHELTTALRRFPEHKAAFVITANLRRWCPAPSNDDAKSPHPTVANERQYDDAPRRGDLSRAAEGAGDVMRVLAAVEKSDASRCLSELFSSTKIIADLAQAANQQKRFRVERIVYWAGRQYCSYLSSGHDWDRVVPLDKPPVDGYGGSEERLRLVAAIAECERTGKDATTADSCVAKWREQRETQFEDARKRTLAEIDARIGTTRTKLEGIERQAYRLPDGRPVFRDYDVWRLKDGSVVTAAVFESRVPHPDDTADALLPRSNDHLNAFINGAVEMAGWYYRKSGEDKKATCILGRLFPEQRFFADLTANFKAYPKVRVVHIVDVLLDRHCGSSTAPTADLSRATFTGRVFPSWTEAYRLSFYSAAVGTIAYFHRAKSKDEGRANCVLDHFMVNLSTAYLAFAGAVGEQPSAFIVNILHDQITRRCG